MSQLIIVFFVGFLFLGIAFFLGPKVSLEITENLPEIPDDITAYLEKSESQYTDIQPDTEKSVIWVDEKRKNRTKVSLVYIHGFSATRQEVSPLVENIAKELSANVFFTRITGHGRSNDAMSEVSLNTMINDGLEALEVGKKIGEQVLLIGNSTGATLITWLAAKKNMINILGLVLMSPNYALKNKKSKWLLLPWAEYFIPLIENPTYRFEPANPLQAKYWTYEYPVNALFSMVALVSVTSKLNLEQIKLPTLVLYSEDDAVIDVGEIKTTFPKLGSATKKLIEVKGTQGKQHHVVAGDILSPGTTEFVKHEILTFIKSI